MATISDNELSQLAALAAKAATSADRPAWARIMNDAAHVAELMAANPPPTRYQDLDAIRRGVAEVKAELARKAQTAQGRNTEPERGSADTPTP